MTHPPEKVAVYLEVGKKRTLAGALDWPGWCRAGRDQAQALSTLLESGSRYARVLSASRISFQAPTDVSAFTISERLQGNATTDFGAPDAPPSCDADPVNSADLARLRQLMQSCWSALDTAAEAAKGKELRKGPRGGGRDLTGILEHVLDAELGYLARLGGQRPKLDGKDNLTIRINRQREAVLVALGAATRGEFPLQGPRGGTRWTPRFFLRRAAWHVLDHVWEIEDRVVE